MTKTLENPSRRAFFRQTAMAASVLGATVASRSGLAPPPPPPVSKQTKQEAGYRTTRLGHIAAASARTSFHRTIARKFRDQSPQADGTRISKPSMNRRKGRFVMVSPPLWVAPTDPLRAWACSPPNITTSSVARSVTSR
jgi:hypothetical protein